MLSVILLRMGVERGPSPSVLRTLKLSERDALQFSGKVIKFRSNLLLPFLSTLQMGSAGFSEILVFLYRTVLSHNPEYINIVAWRAISMQ
jgi:hypothetical protein